MASSLRTSRAYRPALRAFAEAVAEAALDEQYLAAEDCMIPQAVTSALAGARISRRGGSDYGSSEPQDTRPAPATIPQEVAA